MVTTRIASAFLGLTGAILQPTNPDPVAQTIRDWIAKQEQDLRAGYTLYQRYYKGEQDVHLTNRLRQFLPTDLKFRDNFCGLVVDTLAERLTVQSFASPTDEALTEWAQEIWRLNRMDQEQIVVHSEALLNGDAYVLVDYDAEEQRPRLTYQPADTITPRYDSVTRKLAYVAKKWLVQANGQDGPVTRMNLYYPERIEKYVLYGAVWRPFEDEGDLAWPLPWLDQVGAPLGITLIHFRNQPMGDDFGSSELANIVPIQDLLNKALVDLVMILDTLGFAQRWGIGIDAPASTFRTAPGSFWNMKSSDPASAKVGQFESAAVDGPLKTIETLIQHISAISRTPQHLFQMAGGAPSGEALKTSESGLVHKAKLRQVGFGNSWEDVIRAAARLESAFGSQVFIDPSVEAQWKDPETHNEESFIAALGIKRTQLGVPEVQIWREAGYSAEQIAQMLQDKQDEQVASSNIGAAILQSFNSGEPGQV